MDIRADILHRQAYYQHLIEQMPSGLGRSSYEMLVGYRLDLLDENGKFRPISELVGPHRKGKDAALLPLPKEADSFAVVPPPVDIKAVQERLKIYPPCDDKLVYQALAEKGDYSFVRPDGMLQDMRVLKYYYDLPTLLEEVRPKPVPASKEVLMAKLSECEDERDRDIYYELAREGCSFIQADGTLIPPGELDLNWKELGALLEGSRLHRFTDRIATGKDLYDMLADRKQAAEMDIVNVINALPAPIIKEFFNTVLAEHRSEAKLYHVLQELVDLTGKPEKYPHENSYGEGYGDDFGDDLDDLFSASFDRFSYSRILRGVNYTTREKGLRYIGNVVGKTHDHRSGKSIELPITQGIRLALNSLAEPFPLERPARARLQDGQVKGKVPGVSDFRRDPNRPMNSNEQYAADALKDKLFGPGWREKGHGGREV